MKSCALRDLLIDASNRNTLQWSHCCHASKIEDGLFVSGSVLLGYEGVLNLTLMCTCFQRSSGLGESSLLELSRLGFCTRPPKIIPDC